MARRTILGIVMMALSGSTGAAHPLEPAIDPKAARLLADGVVGDGTRLACTAFSIVSFFNGVPEHLK